MTSGPQKRRHLELLMEAFDRACWWCGSPVALRTPAGLGVDPPRDSASRNLLYPLPPGRPSGPRDYVLACLGCCRLRGPDPPQVWIGRLEAAGRAVRSRDAYSDPPSSRVSEEAWRAVVSKPGAVAPVLDRLLELHGALCWWCGAPTERVRCDDGQTPPDWAATRDHYLPRSRGGRDTVQNLVLACWRCNQERGSRGARPWAQRLVALGRGVRTVAEYAQYPSLALLPESDPPGPTPLPSPAPDAPTAPRDPRPAHVRVAAASAILDPPPEP